LLVIGWTQLLCPHLLQIPRVACLGFHASLLPKYRGRAPINWALINGEDETGNTLMVLSPEADEGEIVGQRVISISDEDDCASLYEKVSSTEVEMLSEVLQQARQGGVPRRKQNSADATVMPRRRPEDGLIEWNRTSRKVYDWIRALTKPYPGAFTFARARKIMIWKARLDVSCATQPRPAGTVSLDADGLPLVATADGFIRLLLLQREGEPEVSGMEAGRTFLKPPIVLGASSLGDLV
jgi:methionyl-tRNA formyltransferase